MLDALLAETNDGELDPHDFVYTVKNALYYEGCEWRTVEWDPKGQDTLQFVPLLKRQRFGVELLPGRFLTGLCGCVQGWVGRRQRGLHRCRRHEEIARDLVEWQWGAHSLIVAERLGEAV